MIVSWVPLKNQSAPGPPVSVLGVAVVVDRRPEDELRSRRPTPALIFAIRVA